MNELRYEQYNRAVVKEMMKNSMNITEQPKWTEPSSPIEVDIVFRPNYYGGKDNPHEVFKVLEAWNLDKDFYLGNVIKYISRAGKKNSAAYKEDLQKALVYLQRRIDSL